VTPERLRRREEDPGIVLRVKVLSTFAGIVLLVVLTRAWWLQVARYEHYHDLAENNRLRIRTIRAPRGQILDRKGRPLAETQGSFDLICTPVDAADLDREMALLSRIVDFDDEGEARSRVLQARKSNPFSSVTVARDLRFEQVSVIEYNREALPGFSIMVEAKRSYPYGEGLAHVLGYVGEVSDKELDDSPDETLEPGDIVGKYGLERGADLPLRGRNGGRRVEVDAAGRDRRLVDEIPPHSGGTLMTTLDLDLQQVAYEGLAGRAGTVIAMDPRNGDVLAFASSPAFDPNAFSRGIRKGEWKSLVEDPRKPMQNKGLQGTYAPGSTVKPFLALAALESGLMTPTQKLHCGGAYAFGDRVFRCWKDKGHGDVDMYRAIVQSCDVYFYQVGRKVGAVRTAAVERGAGLGVLTGIDLPGERAGVVPDPEWKAKHSKEKWYEFEDLLLGIGQGTIHVTPLEMVQGYAALAMGGKVVRPRIMTRYARRDGRFEEFPARYLREMPWKKENVELVRKALWGVVNDYGTAGIAKIPGVAVGGKTGTAQVASMKGARIKSEDLPYELRDHAWFVAFAPVEDPRIVVCAMLEHGGHGGSAAAPAVRQVMEEFFRLEKGDAPPGAGGGADNAAPAAAGGGAPVRPSDNGAGRAPAGGAGTPRTDRPAAPGRDAGGSGGRAGA
jgi:penicillin-binding protein 2